MRILSAIAASFVAASLVAQSPLVCNPVGVPAGFVWTFSTSGANYYDLTVNTTITLQALRFGDFSAAGVVGSVNFWMTDGLTPATQTHQGNETNPGAWTLMSTGVYESPGVVAMSTSCQTPGVVIQPGTYGICLEHVGLLTEWTAMNPGSQVPFSNAELTITNGITQATPFTSAVGQINLPAGYAPGPVDQQSRLQLFYEVGAVSHSCAGLSYYGEGCYKKSASPYQRFATAAAASTALQGNSLSFVPNAQGTGYVIVSPAASIEGAYRAPGTLPGSLGLNQLAPGDDTENVISTLTPVMFPTVTGLLSASQLWVHSNGYISVDSDGDLNGSNNQLSGVNYIPVREPFLGAPEMAWWSWHDFNSSEAGSGVINWEENGATVAITYLDMESYPNTVANKSTVQFQFDVTGIVSIFWPTVDAAGGSTWFGGDATLVGWSPAGASPDDGGIDLASVFGGQSVTRALPEQFPMRLDASGTPKLGSTVNLLTGNETTNPGVGLLFVSAGQVPAPGLDLGIIGAPGCPALIDSTVGVGNLISNFAPFGQMNVPLTVPNLFALSGATVFCQSVWLDPAANAFGLLTTNGVALQLGVF